jgi:hypothetical protein
VSRAPSPPTAPPAARPPIRKGDRALHATDTDGRFPTLTTRRTIVATGAKLAYAAPLVAISVTLRVTNVAAAVSLGSLCAAGSVFFSRVALNDPEGDPIETAACCFCNAGSGSGLPGAAAACRARRPVQIAFDPSHPVECPNALVGEVILDCFARCDAVP